jgi:rare lipoprotein A
LRSFDDPRPHPLPSRETVFVRSRVFATHGAAAQRLALAVVLALAAFLAPNPAAVPGAHAASSAKVAIIVGPAGSSTAAYRSDADLAATEALKYTSNVVKVYSPNATWDAVKGALAGASIVIYMGHGSGFPSPHSTTLQADRQDGFGVNPHAGGDDATTEYRGEQYLFNEIRLAPNAVVILGHLCYASGSSEPGYAAPTAIEAQQRVDNYAAGFFAAGARAVFAEAYNGAAAGYVRGLFTAHTTVGAIWASSSHRQGNASSFESTRTPGMIATTDPETGTGRYWRSLAGDQTLSTDVVVGFSADPAGTPAATPVPTPAPSPVTATPAPSPAPSTSPTASPAQTANAGSAPVPVIGSVRWTTTSVNVRGHPTTASKRLFVLAPSTPVRIVRQATDIAKRTWYLVRVQSRLGWLAGWLTRATRAAPVPAPAPVPSLSPSPATGTPGWLDARAASYGVGDGLMGSPMACGGVLDDTVPAVAHLSLPCGTKLLIRVGGIVTPATVLDRGPYVAGLTFDLGPAVCRALNACDGITSIQWQVAP